MKTNSHKQYFENFGVVFYITSSWLGMLVILRESWEYLELRSSPECGILYGWSNSAYSLIVILNTESPGPLFPLRIFQRFLLIKTILTWKEFIPSHLLWKQEPNFLSCENVMFSQYSSRNLWDWVIRKCMCPFDFWFQLVFSSGSQRITFYISFLEDTWSMLLYMCMEYN